MASKTTKEAFTVYYGECNNSFYGNEISDYGLAHGFVDYRALAESFDAILNNDIIAKTKDTCLWECVNGSDYDEENDCYEEVFQTYIISEEGFEILSRYTNEIVWHNEQLDLYVWGVTHYGTSWDYVLTDIRINRVFE